MSFHFFRPLRICQIPPFSIFLTGIMKAILWGFTTYTWADVRPAFRSETLSMVM